MYTSPCVYPFTCFHRSEALSDAAVNTSTQVTLRVPVLTPLGIYPRVLGHRVLGIQVFEL